MNFATVVALFALGIQVASSQSSIVRNRVLRQGDSFEVDGSNATLKRLNTLPYLESEYTMRFKFDSYANPKLKELRKQYKLDEVVAPGRDEFDKQVLLMDWAHRQFRKFGKPSSDAKGALDILKAIEEGHTFF